MSPLFFSIYMDELLLKLKNAGFGCHIGNYYFGALGYADDIVLICPTKEGLRNMIRICETYAAEHDLIFNGNCLYSELSWNVCQHFMLMK